MRGSRHPAEGDLKPNHLGTPLSLGGTEHCGVASFASRPNGGVTQMVTNKTQHSRERPVKQGSGRTYREANRIGASTPFDFSGKNLTPYGGLLPVATMLEKLGFQ